MDTHGNDFYAIRDRLYVLISMAAIVASRRDLTAQLSARTNFSRKKLKEKKKNNKIALSYPTVQSYYQKREGHGAP